MLPAPLEREVMAALAQQLGDTHASVQTAAAVGGGCISNATRLTTTGGERVFLKWNHGAALPAGSLRAEAHSLAALGATCTVRVPRVIALADEADAAWRWLLLEWLEPGRADDAAWRGLARDLAALHQVRADCFGWAAANFIGSLPQSNDASAHWPDFWRNERLLPQLERASSAGLLRAAERNRFDRLLADLDEVLAAGSEEGASLLHGDLWSGNAHATAGGIALIDPASYHGHREVDLAMATLFGGFSRGFYEEYETAWPLRPGWQQRRTIYQLYYLLVHVNLFGGSYVQQTSAAVAQLGF